MVGLVPTIHDFSVTPSRFADQDVDSRDKPEHDGTVTRRVSAVVYSTVRQSQISGKKRMLMTLSR
jgi:hypothetical protein